MCVCLTPQNTNLSVVLIGRPTRRRRNKKKREKRKPTARNTRTPPTQTLTTGWRRRTANPRAQVCPIGAHLSAPIYSSPLCDLSLSRTLALMRRQRLTTCSDARCARSMARSAQRPSPHSSVRTSSPRRRPVLLERSKPSHSGDGRQPHPLARARCAWRRPRSPSPPPPPEVLAAMVPAIGSRQADAAARPVEA